MMKYDNEGAVYSREIYPVQSLPSGKDQYFMTCERVMKYNKEGADYSLNKL